MAGKCPACGKNISSVSIRETKITQGIQPVFHGVSYVCPNIQCQTILGVGIDPIALKTDIVNEILRGLGKRR